MKNLFSNFRTVTKITPKTPNQKAKAKLACYPIANTRKMYPKTSENYTSAARDACDIKNVCLFH